MSKDETGKPPQEMRSLKAFEVLLGEWTMVGTHPQLPSTLHGHSTFEWLREGALLAWHFNWEQGQGIPNAYSIIGHDDALEVVSMLYTDERGVARIYQMSLENGLWKQWRDSSGFSQRMIGRFSDDGNSIHCQGELSRDGSSWEQDLRVSYTRKR